MRKRRAYLAGPMRGIPEYNYPAFFAGAAALEAKGWEVLNPAAMDIEADNTDYTQTPVDMHEAQLTNGLVRRFANRDTQAILSLRAELGDAIIVLPNWETSTGARAETALAEWVRLPRLTLEEALEA